MPTPSPSAVTGDLSTFNILHGFPEALVRGMRSSFLKDADYHHLTQCETLDDVRLNLSESDYSDALADSSTMTPATFQKAAIEKVRVRAASLGGDRTQNSPFRSSLPSSSTSGPRRSSPCRPSLISLRSST